jgi:hypothetical protein
LVDAVRKHVLTASKRHAYDTPVPVLTPGMGKTKTARLGPMYAMIVSQAIQPLPPSGSLYSEDRKGEHPKQHLSEFSGILQAHGFAGSIISMKKAAGSSKPRVGRTSGASVTTSMWPTIRQSQLKPSGE